jgi:hypothetical protein
MRIIAFALRSYLCIFNPTKIQGVLLAYIQSDLRTSGYHVVFVTNQLIALRRSTLERVPKSSFYRVLDDPKRSPRCMRLI